MPEQNGYLFIGGPMDGVWRAIQSDYPAISIGVHCGTQCDYELYNKIHIASDTAVYVHATLNPREALAALIAGYQRSETPACPSCMGHGCRLCSRSTFPDLTRF